MTYLFGSQRKPEGPRTSYRNPGEEDPSYLPIVKKPSIYVTLPRRNHARANALAIVFASSFAASAAFLGHVAYERVSLQKTQLITPVESFEQSLDTITQSSFESFEEPIFLEGFESKERSNNHYRGIPEFGPKMARKKTLLANTQ